MTLTIIRFISRFWPGLTLLAMAVWMPGAQAQIVEFDSTRWDLSGAVVTEHLGRPCIQGAAYLDDVVFENGVIEVDIAADGKTSYPGIIFRKQDDKNYERFYIRPHRAGLYPDALQYTPVINGIAGWQLYHGDGFTAATEMALNEWVHLKMEISGSQAQVYLGETPEPGLTINYLKHGSSRGGIGLLGPRDGSAYFSNFSYRVDESLVFEPPPPEETPLGMLTDWELSQTFKYSRIDLEKYPAEQGLELTWQPVSSEPSGLVDIAWTYARQPGESDWVYARTTLTSPSGERRQIWFGYSDYIGIFLNGEMLYFGNSAYRSRDRSFLGVVGLSDAVYLPLQAGDNELLFCIGEAFGGWGFMAQDGQAVFQHESLTELWNITQTFKFPESVVYDPQWEILYITNFFNGGNNEFISRVHLNGDIDQLEWITGLDRPTGLALHKDKLYVVERASLVVIDIEKAAIADRYPIPEAVFPNDIAIRKAKEIYISDSGRNIIYRFDGKKIEPWLEAAEIVDPNTLHLRDKSLIVGNSGDGWFKVVDLKTKQITPLVGLGSGAILDGIKEDGRGNLLLADFNGRLFRVDPAGEKTELLNTSARAINCADFDYIPAKSLLILPTLYSNSVTAYHIENP